MLSSRAPWDSSKPFFKSFTTKSHFPYSSHLACICILSMLLNTEAACLGYNKVIWWRKVLLLLLDVQSRTSSGELRKKKKKWLGWAGYKICPIDWRGFYFYFFSWETQAVGTLSQWCCHCNRDLTHTVICVCITGSLRSQCPGEQLTLLVLCDEGSVLLCTKEWNERQWQTQPMKWPLRKWFHLPHHYTQRWYIPFPVGHVWKLSVKPHFSCCLFVSQSCRLYSSPKCLPPAYTTHI